MLWFKWINIYIEAIQILLLTLIAGLTIFYYRLRKEG